MSMSGNTSTISPAGGVERRANHHLRELFEQAYNLATPMFDSNVSSATHFLRITLHDAFPHLHQQDIAILCVAIERVHRERNRAGN